MRRTQQRSVFPGARGGNGSPDLAAGAAELGNGLSLPGKLSAAVLVGGSCCFCGPRQGHRPVPSLGDQHRSSQQPGHRGSGY